MIGENVVAEVIGKVIDRVWPDESKKAEALLEFEKFRETGQLQLMLAQIEVNKAEAAHPDRFVSGWRPAVGWVCAAAFGWHYIGAPFLEWAAALAGNATAVPEVELGDLFTLMLGLLGLGGLRTYEKSKGVAQL